ncbi:hypothetical protein CHLRE_06g291600v5 [Chlamydomonas reinhardtii]|uniref:ethanolamine kinase n=1 Tax=Chlamydomonas reinhardtii TaxID=3055 RepID=A0A2K3DQA3_CHLRE|nr:uncharacterized protein CHLRE_06g291600v5 [Chlamydomonas reinhardtii]PNW82726.1 hypothetical protein CHLRE_06g291600v5 [Chlamydomonas reinhardtii]
MSVSKSPPEDPADVSFAEGQEEAERSIKKLCKRLLPGWSDLQEEDMRMSKISGGISNLLVKVEPPAPLQAVAVKVFGDKTELLIDREAEKHTLLRLNAVGFGAPVVGLFGNGRIEAFLPCKTLTPEEMAHPGFVPHIAARLRAFHDLPGMDSAFPTASTINSTSASASAPTSAAAAGAAAATAGPQPHAPSPQSSQWDAIFGWLDMAEQLSFAHDPAKQAAFDKVDFAAMRAELAQLKELCDRVASPRVFCHNDLLSGNILVIAPSASPAAAAPEPSASDGAATMSGVEDGGDVLGGGRLQFIDFEYSCAGPRGFDLGNHFNEYAGFDCDYTRFPTLEQQAAFFRHYLKPGELQALATAARARRPAELGAAAPQAAAEAAALEALAAEACIYALASHAYWGVWSFIQARYSPIDFDYLDYSALRWAEYHRRKAEFVALVDKNFPA